MINNNNKYIDNYNIVNNIYDNNNNNINNNHNTYKSIFP